MLSGAPMIEESVRMNREMKKPFPSRRGVLRQGTLGAMALATPVIGADAGQSSVSEEKISTDIPKRMLGKTGVKVTRLGMGASFPTYGRRMLDLCYSEGVRYFDNSEWYNNYKAEPELGDWIGRRENRDDVFVVTKAQTVDPEAFEGHVDRSLNRLRIDTVDLMFVHGIDDPEIPKDRDGRWGKLKEKLVRDKKIRFMGFSTHATPMERRVGCLNEAAKSGWVDALMVACDPGLIAENDDFNRALDACAKAKVGLVAMKTSRGLGKLLDQPEKAVEKFKALNMTPHQAMIAGIWSDERFAAVCSEMSNRNIVKENTELARRFAKPFDADQHKLLLEGIRSLARATCPGCTGACRRAAGTNADLCSIARYLAYYEEDGKRQDARRMFQSLPASQRDWRGADLKAASQACTAKLDFESILSRAKRCLS